MRALASHQCDPGSIPGRGVICGLSLLLALVLAPRVFLQVLRFSFPPKIPTFPNFNSTWNAQTPLNELREFFGASWVNKLHLRLHFTRQPILLHDRCPSKSKINRLSQICNICLLNCRWSWAFLAEETRIFVIFLQRKSNTSQSGIRDKA